MIATDTSPDNYDVIIVGAGISGINFAYRLQTENPDLSFTILEGRDAIGGTWDFFKYPGLRSDSDLYTFGFPWRPWNKGMAIAESSLILDYMRESAAMYGIDKKIHFRHEVSDANFSSEEQAWQLSVSANGTPATFRSRFLLMCTGYYDYKQALPSMIPGIENFKGKVVHPQFWPKDLDYSNKSMVIVGSGATAVTLLPVLAEKASHVTMLQRSPSFVVSQPKTDRLEIAIRKIFPVRIAHRLVRWKWLALPFLLINFCHKFPNAARRLFIKGAAKQLPPGIPTDPHFEPSYNPFEQRVCFCPDGDFYASLRSGKSSVVTGVISSCTANSIKLEGGQELNPDIIITATGLKLQLGGGTKITVDDKPFVVKEKYLWKGVMIQDVPNLAIVFGYADASWTLGADATAQLVCRLLKKMKASDTAVVVPRVSDAERKKMKDVPMLNLTSTYVKRANESLPKTGNLPQWLPRRLYWRDIWQAWFGDIRGGLEYIKTA